MLVSGSRPTVAVLAFPVGSSVEILQQYTPRRARCFTASLSGIGSARCRGSVLRAKCASQRPHPQLPNATLLRFFDCHDQFHPMSDKPTRTSEIISHMPPLLLTLLQLPPPGSTQRIFGRCQFHLNLFYGGWFSRVVPLFRQLVEIVKLRDFERFLLSHGERIRRRSDSSIYTGMSPLSRLFDAAGRLMDTTGSRLPPLQGRIVLRISTTWVNLAICSRESAGRPLGIASQRLVPRDASSFIRFARSCNSRQ